jgi:hypothetical protein
MNAAGFPIAGVAQTVGIFKNCFSNGSGLFPSPLSTIENHVSPMEVVVPENTVKPEECITQV